MLNSMLRSMIVVSCVTLGQLSAADWSLKDSRQGWNTPELVKLYFHNSDMQTQWAWKALSHYKFHGDENVLDFGSGDGKLTAMVSCLVPNGQIIGVDLSKDMIFHASKMYSPERYHHLSFIQCDDITTQTFPAKFDLVTSFCVFHLVPDPEKVLAALRQTMNPSGKLVMTYPLRGNPEFFRAVAEELAVRGWALPLPTSSSSQMRDPEQAKLLFSLVGLKLEVFEIVKTRDAFASREELIDWFEGTLAANWNIPKEGRRQFFMDVTERYLSYRPSEHDEDGFYYYSLSRIDLVASLQ